MSWIGHIARTVDMKIIYEILTKKTCRDTTS